MAIEKFASIKVENFEDYNAEIHRITVESIQIALLQLLEKKQYVDISIKELVETAGVSRSAFYRNYKSKEDVVESLIYDSLKRKFRQAVVAVESENNDTKQNLRDQWITVIKEMFLENDSVYRLITSGACQGNDILRCMNHCYTEVLVGSEDDAEIVRYIYMIGGIYNILLHWLDAGKTIDPQKIAEVIMSFYE